MLVKITGGALLSFRIAIAYPLATVVVFTDGQAEITPEWYNELAMAMSTLNLTIEQV